MSVSTEEGAFNVARPTGYSWPQIKSVIWQAGQDTIDMDMSMRAAGVAFFLFLSIFPALAAALAIAGLLLDPSDIRFQTTPFAAMVPESVASVIDNQIDAFVRRDNALGISLLISLAVALWSGTRGSNALIHAINKTYREDDTRTFLRGFFASLATTLGAIFVLLGTVAALTVLPAFLAVFPAPLFVEQLTLLLRWPVIAAVISLGLFALYRMTPDREAAKSRWVWPGALVATVLWVIGSALLSFYIENYGAYEATFGSIAAAAILMLWLNFTATVFIFGAALNARLEWKTRRDTTTGRDKPMGERGAVVADTRPQE